MQIFLFIFSEFPLLMWASMGSIGLHRAIWEILTHPRLHLVRVNCNTITFVGLIINYSWWKLKLTLSCLETRTQAQKTHVITYNFIYDYSDEYSQESNWLRKHHFIWITLYIPYIGKTNPALEDLLNQPPLPDWLASNGMLSILFFLLLPCESIVKPQV